jgi:5-methylcytosine-specific restriction endonuclease McrA
VGRALLLNSTYEALCVLSTRRAVTLVLADRAELVEATGRVWRSERMCVGEPSVIRLRRYVRVPKSMRVAVNRRTVFLRDHGRCQYCGGPAESIDHVLPRSRGGTHTWDNVVAACRRCNGRKQDRLLAESGFRLRRIPREPRDMIGLLALAEGIDDSWSPFIGSVPTWLGDKSGDAHGPGRGCSRVDSISESA